MTYVKSEMKKKGLRCLYYDYTTCLYRCFFKNLSILNKYLSKLKKSFIYIYI